MPDDSHALDPMPAVVTINGNRVIQAVPNARVMSARAPAKRQTCRPAGKPRALRRRNLLFDYALKYRYQCCPAILNGRPAIQETLYIFWNPPSREELMHVAFRHPPNGADQQGGLYIFRLFRRSFHKLCSFPAHKKARGPVSDGIPVRGRPQERFSTVHPPDTGPRA